MHLPEPQAKKSGQKKNLTVSPFAFAEGASLVAKGEVVLGHLAGREALTDTAQNPSGLNEGLKLQPPHLHDAGEFRHEGLLQVLPWRQINWPLICDNLICILLVQFLVASPESQSYVFVGNYSLDSTQWMQILLQNHEEKSFLLCFIRHTA